MGVVQCKNLVSTSPPVELESGSYRTVVKGLPVRRTLAGFVVGLAMLSPADHAVTAAQQTRVLVLYSTRRSAQIAVVGDRELPRVLEGGWLRARLTLNISTWRGSRPAYQSDFHDFPDEIQRCGSTSSSRCRTRPQFIRCSGASCLRRGRIFGELSPPGACRTRRRDRQLQLRHGGAGGRTATRSPAGVRRQRC